MVCTTGSFSGTFISTGPYGTGICSSEDTIEWGDGSGERTPSVNGQGNEEIVLSHQYSKPGIYEVEVSITTFCGDKTHGPVTAVWYTVEVPGPQTCEQGLRTAASSDDPCSEKNCAVSFLGFCLIDSDVKDARDQVDDLKKKIEKASAIPDREKREKQLNKLENELRSAAKEYRKLVKQAKKDAEQNAQELGVPVQNILHEFNTSLNPKK